MKIKVLILTLIVAAAAVACVAADTYKLRLNYNTNSRYTYECDDGFKLLSATAFNRNLLDQQYELEVNTLLYERALAKDKNGNFKLKSYADIKEIELNGKKQPLKQNGDYLVALISPLNKYLNVVQTSIQGEVKNYDGSKSSKYPVFVNYSDFASALFVLPKDEVAIGETWYPEAVQLDNGGYIKSQFSITQVKKGETEDIAYIHGTATAVVDVQSGVRFFRRVIPANLLGKRYNGKAQIEVTDYEVKFSLTKGVVRDVDMESNATLTITDSSNGSTITAYLQADWSKELKSIK